MRVRLLTASMGTRAKRKVLQELADGTAQIVIGTHALLSDEVSFHDLGLVVVDEQHRFGVEQRDGLRGTDGALPHRLVMTATPIPRTVAMTVFGDLDVSVLDTLPAADRKSQRTWCPSPRSLPGRPGCGGAPAKKSTRATRCTLSYPKSGRTATAWRRAPRSLAHPASTVQARATQPRAISVRAVAPVVTARFS